MSAIYPTTINWHSAKLDRPTRSGDYLCAYHHGGASWSFTTLSYSSKHDMFNVLDCQSKEDSKVYAIEWDENAAMYWADFHEKDFMSALLSMAMLEETEEEFNR